jgi:hypothetical protein
MNNHCGLDNRLLLPPYPPALRNADGVFGQLLKACQPRHLIAHLPQAVLHLPEEQRVFAGEARLLPRLSDLLMLLVRSLAPASWMASSQQGGLGAVGEGLLQAGSLSPPEFAALWRELWAEELSRYALGLEQLLESFGDEPAFWAADARSWLEQTRRSIASEQPLAPADLGDRGSPEEAGALCRKVVLAYGELLQAWPTLRTEAALLAAAGVSLARPL